ncbi:hypothetical protein [Brevifollis gellanilyticus]|uniref:Uncharacterized protein n=1 Tax=Brevifollis gellanilyticus TaxID=748831 RepID=A0A512ME15_9BACT|nr:hypothetical protein [Brevifollis gellanilyticus]GEP44985.1 hypothetical protein BGE01nite_42760 [Brevifollis gellanilyticus]
MPNIDFSDIPIIGQKVCDDGFLSKVIHLPGVDESDLIDIYKSLGPGSYCGRIDLFAGSVRPVGENVPSGDGSYVPSDAIMIGFERDGPCIAVASDGQTAFFYLILWGQDMAYRFTSFESTLLKMAELSGLVALYQRPFYLVRGVMTYCFNVNLDYHSNVEVIITAIKKARKVWTFRSIQHDEDNTLALDDSGQFLVRVSSRSDRNVTLFFNRAQLQCAKEFYDRWIDALGRKGLGLPERAI